MSRSLASVLMMLLLLATGCASTSRVESAYTGRAIEVDGDLVEWVDHLEEQDRGRLRLGIQHDADYVYLALVTPDEDLIRQIRDNGLTFWLGPEEIGTRSRGVRYPVPFADPTRSSTEQVDVFLESDKHIRRPVAAEPYFRAASSFDFGVFTVEMRIPIGLESDSDIRILPGPDETFALEIESAVVDREPESEADRRTERARSTGMPGSGFDTMGGVGGRLGEGPGLPTNMPLDLKVTISLVSRHT